MVVDYSKGKIYKIVSVSNPDLPPYIGSTCQSLANRMAGHRGEYKRRLDGKSKKKISSFDILANGDSRIILVEDFPCKRKEELFQRERYWIERLACANLTRPIVTKEEYNERRREYYEANKADLKASQRAYVLEKKEYVLGRQKAWRERNKERISERDRAYRMKNRDQIKTRQVLYTSNHREQANARNQRWVAKHKNHRVICNCDDSSTFSYTGLPQHRRSKKHQSWEQATSQKLCFLFHIYED